MRFFGQSDEKRAAAKESRRRARALVVKKRRAVFRSWLLLFVFFVLAISAWSLRNIRALRDMPPPPTPLREGGNSSSLVDRHAAIPPSAPNLSAPRAEPVSANDRVSAPENRSALQQIVPQHAQLAAPDQQVLPVVPKATSPEQEQAASNQNTVSAPPASLPKETLKEQQPLVDHPSQPVSQAQPAKNDEGTADTPTSLESQGSPSTTELNAQKGDSVDRDTVAASDDKDDSWEEEEEDSLADEEGGTGPVITLEDHSGARAPAARQRK